MSKGFSYENKRFGPSASSGIEEADIPREDVEILSALASLYAFTKDLKPADLTRIMKRYGNDGSEAKIAMLEKLLLALRSKK